MTASGRRAPRVPVDCSQDQWHPATGWSLDSTWRLIVLYHRPFFFFKSFFNQRKPSNRARPNKPFRTVQSKTSSDVSRIGTPHGSKLGKTKAGQRGSSAQQQHAGPRCRTQCCVFTSHLDGPGEHSWEPELISSPFSIRQETRSASPKKSNESISQSVSRCADLCDLCEPPPASLERPASLFSISDELVLKPKEETESSRRRDRTLTFFL